MKTLGQVAYETLVVAAGFRSAEAAAESWKHPETKGGPKVDKKCWEAAANAVALAARKPLEEEIARLYAKVEQQERRLVNYSWQTNPDRMGS